MTIPKLYQDNLKAQYKEPAASDLASKVVKITSVVAIAAILGFGASFFGVAALGVLAAYPAVNFLVASIGTSLVNAHLIHYVAFGFIIAMSLVTI